MSIRARKFLEKMFLAMFFVLLPEKGYSLPPPLPSQDLLILKWLRESGSPEIFDCLLSAIRGLIIIYFLVTIFLVNKKIANKRPRQEIVSVMIVPVALVVIDIFISLFVGFILVVP